MIKNILGISSGSHDSAACLFSDGKLIAAISEERMSRIKCDGGHLPWLAIDEVLKIGGLNRKNIHGIAFTCGFFPEKYFKHTSISKQFEFRIKSALNYLRGKPYRRINSVDIIKRLKGNYKNLDGLFRKNKFLTENGFSNDCKVHFYDHHKSHAACAAFFSGFNDSAIVTFDGKGDCNIHASFSTYEKGLLKQFRTEDTKGTSSGELYEAITYLLGFIPLRHEGKVLGLAAHGNPDILKNKVLAALRFDSNTKTLTSDFIFDDNPEKSRFDYLKNLIKDQNREDVAAATQTVFEETLTKAIQEFIKDTGKSNLALNGGVFANVKLNQRLSELPEVKNIFVFPAMSDSGNCIGSSILMQEEFLKNYLHEKSHKLQHVYWGTEYSDQDILEALKLFPVKYRLLTEDKLIEITASAIHAEKVVGWFQGRMEFGPRALGNRSMIASPRTKEINTWLNQRLERTEFMPFAPSVPAEYGDAIFEKIETSKHAAEFMTVTYNVKKEWQEKIQAVVHVDGTARPQFVNKATNPKYHKLIEKYKSISGIPVVLNTSFNVHEEPIVRSPNEAIRALIEKRIDYLAIGNYWVEI